MNFYTSNKSKKFNSIDIAHLVLLMFNKIFNIIFVGILSAIIGFSIARFAVTPTYMSSVMLYVNNNSINMSNIGFNISYSELTAAQQLVKTYTEILKNRETLEMIIANTNIDYTWQELGEMISASPANETEIMRVSVTGKDPYEIEKIANEIANVLPARVDSIIEGASMELVDGAVADFEKTAPSIKMYTLAGFLEGVIIYVVILILKAFTNTTVNNEDDILKEYDYPILAKIPNLLKENSNKYSNYKNYYYK